MSKSPQPEVCFDLETTGTIAGWHEAIEIGASLLDSETLLPTTCKFEVKMHFEHPERIDPGVMGVHNHYDEEVWRHEAVSQQDGWRMLADWMFKVSGGGMVRPILVGHNVAKFDYQMMDIWCLRRHIDVCCDYHPMDTIVAYRSWKRLTGFGRYGNRLQDLAIDMGIENPKAHSALADAITAGLGYALLSAYTETLIECGRGYGHEQYLDESYRRVGLPRNDNEPLPIR